MPKNETPNKSQNQIKAYASHLPHFGLEIMPTWVFEPFTLLDHKKTD